MQPRYATVISAVLATAAAAELLARQNQFGSLVIGKDQNLNVRWERSKKKKNRASAWFADDENACADIHRCSGRCAAACKYLFHERGKGSIMLHGHGD